MTSIDLETPPTIFYLLVDDRHKAEGYHTKQGRRRANAVFSDSEKPTLMIAHDYLPYPGETQYVACLRANHRPCSPSLSTKVRTTAALVHEGQTTIAQNTGNNVLTLKRLIRSA